MTFPARCPFHLLRHCNRDRSSIGQITGASALISGATVVCRVALMVIVVAVGFGLCGSRAALHADDAPKKKAGNEVPAKSADVPTKEGGTEKETDLHAKPAVAAENIPAKTHRTGDDVPVARFAFGSCAKQDKPQPIWESIVEFDPRFFVFLGDNIYGDSEDMDVLRAKYEMLGSKPGFQKLKQLCPIYATWDDHDFGANDAGADYPKRRESQQVFCDFFGIPQSDLRRTREGVYWSHVFGPEKKRLQLILLDARYFRSKLKVGFKPGEPGEGRRGKYVPNTDPDATILGEEQWKWLEAQLKVPAELRVIGNGVQVVADEHGSEMWGNFPRERERLFKLIRDTKANGVVFISGDRHLAEISRLPADHPLGVGYPLYDVTSSSLNTPSGNFTKAKTRFGNEINSYRVGLTYFETNFGSVVVDWDEPDPVVRLQVRDETGDVVLQQRVSLSELQPRGKIPRAKPRTKASGSTKTPGRKTSPLKK